MTLPAVSVVIPSYNGLELLKEYLPAVLSSLRSYEGGGEVIVVEDGGSDGTVVWLKENHTSVRAIRLDANEGFAAASNRGVKESKHDVVVLLNNDMAPQGEFFAPLVRRLLGDDRIFAATAKSLTPDGGNESISAAENDGGLILLRQPGLDTKNVFDAPVTLFHSAGGFSAYRRERFLELGGFDSIFHPFYWEDVDLSFRAWRRGWMSVYEPLAQVKHRSHGTIGSLFGRDEYDLIQHSHLHLFHLVNLGDSDLERYLKRVNYLMSETNLYDRGVLRRGFLLALKNPLAIMERRKTIGGGKSLDEIIEASNLRGLK